MRKLSVFEAQELLACSITFVLDMKLKDAFVCPLDKKLIIEPFDSSEALGMLSVNLNFDNPGG